MELSVIRDRRCHWQGPFPDYASLHPGYGAFADDDTRGSVPTPQQRAPRGSSRGRPPAAADAVGCDLFVEDLIDRGLLISGSMSPAGRIVIDRPLGGVCGSNPSLTDQMQALVIVSHAYSTASRGFCVIREP